MRIGLSLAFLTPGTMGGLEVYARQLTQALAARSDLELVLFLSRPAARERAWAELGRPVVLAVNPERRVDWLRADQGGVPRAARRAKVDLVHSLASTGPVVGPFARVVTVHDLHYRTHPDAHFGVRALGMRVLVPLGVARADRVVVPSRSTRADLLRFTRVSPDRVDVVPEGIGQTMDRTPDAEAARERHGAGDRQLVLSVSAKRPHKNLARLIGALARVPAERRPLLVLPGYPTPHEEELRRLANERGVQRDVRFVGWVSLEELDDLYAAATCFVFPSLIEGFGLPVLEAMARGVPVATSGRDSLSEVACDAALTFDPEDESSIAASMERLLGDEALRDRLRAAGYERAAGYTWERAAELTVETYRRALAER